MKLSAVLIDLDGTIYQGNALIPGAKEILYILQDAKIPYRFISNITRMTKRKLVNKLGEMGLVVSEMDICAAPHAAAIYCQNQKYNNIMLVVQDTDIQNDFSAFHLVDHNPDAIVLGDMGHAFTFELLNNLFNHIIEGAQLVAMQKNRYWKSVEGYKLDVGAFVSALEYSSGRPAIIVGKPNPNHFDLASQEWNFPSNEIIMVGDDLSVDIGGALSAGMQSVLVKTGKFRETDLQKTEIKPNYIIDSILDLPAALGLN